MDPFSEDPLFSDTLKKEEIVDPNEGQMRLAAGKDKGWPVKKEADTLVVKEEVEDGEMWGGGYVKRGNTDFGENPEPKRRKWTPGIEASSSINQKELEAEAKKEVEPPTSAQVARKSGKRPEVIEKSGKRPESSRKTRRIAFGHGATEDHEEATEEPFSAVSGSAVPPTSDETEDSLPFAKHVSFSAHVLLSNEAAVKEEVAEEGIQNVTDLKRNCPVDGCLENFLIYADLIDHMRKHPTPLICAVCKKFFSCPSKLRQHFACTFCTKRFSHSRYLLKHLQTHLGQRPDVCEICGFETSSLVKLKKHKQLHTEEKRYSCTICGFQTAYSETLFIHKKIAAH